MEMLQTMQCSADKFMLNFHDNRPSADLSNEIKKSLKWDLLQHRRAMTDLHIFHKIRNNLDNIVIPNILVQSII